MRDQAMQTEHKGDLESGLSFFMYLWQCFDLEQNERNVLNNSLRIA